MPKPKYATPEDFLKVALDYFEKCEVDKKKTTQAGLTVFAGLNTKMAFNDLAKRKSPTNADFTWSDLISRIRLMLEDAAWQRGNAIDMFYLKNYHGMADKREVDLSGEVSSKQVVISADMDAEKAAALYEQLIQR